MGAPHYYREQQSSAGPLIRWFEKGAPVFSARKFLLRITVGLLLLVILSVALNVALDIYGLFRPVTDRTLEIYHEERISKYLLMHRYVPANYDGILIGTSLSDNLDISAYNAAGKKYRFYNGSMMGANISEVRTIAAKAVEGGVRNVVFCVSPYQFKNTGAKEVELNSKLYYGALGSWNLYETYAVALVRRLEILPHKFPKAHINEDGVNHFESRYRAEDVAERIAQVAAVHRGHDFPIDEEALLAFRQMIADWKTNGVRFLVYFHPVPAELYEAQRAGYGKFEQIVREAIADESKILDLNAPEWKTFTTDYSNYIDNGHLSETGQTNVTFSVFGAFEYLYP